MSLPNWYTERMSEETEAGLILKGSMQRIALNIADIRYELVVGSASFAEHFQSAQNGESFHFQGIDDTNWREVAQTLRKAITDAVLKENKQVVGVLLGLRDDLLLAAMICAENDRISQLHNQYEEQQQNTHGPLRSCDDQVELPPTDSPPF